MVTNDQVTGLWDELRAARKALREAGVKLEDARRAVDARELDLWAAERLAIRLNDRFLALADRS